MPARYACSLWPSRSEIIADGVSSGIGIGFASPGRLSITIIPAAPAFLARASFETNVQFPRRTSAIAPSSAPAGSVDGPELGVPAGPHRYASTAFASVPRMVETSTIGWSAVDHFAGSFAPPAD